MAPNLWGLPGQAVPEDGWLVPNDAPGFGLDVSPGWILPVATRLAINSSMTSHRVVACKSVTICSLLRMSPKSINRRVDPYPNPNFA